MIDHRVLSLMKHRFLLWKHSSAVGHLSIHNLEQRGPLQRKGEHPVCTHFIYNVVLIFYQYTLCFQQPIFNLILAGGNHRLQVYQRMQSAPIRWFTLSRSNSRSFLLYPGCIQYKYFAKEKAELTPPLWFFFPCHVVSDQELPDLENVTILMLWFCCASSWIRCPSFYSCSHPSSWVFDFV